MNRKSAKKRARLEQKKKDMATLKELAKALRKE